MQDLATGPARRQATRGRAHSRSRRERPKSLPLRHASLSSSCCQVLNFAAEAREKAVASCSCADESRETLRARREKHQSSEARLTPELSGRNHSTLRRHVFDTSSTRRHGVETAPACRRHFVDTSSTRRSSWLQGRRFRPGRGLLGTCADFTPTKGPDPNTARIRAWVVPEHRM